MDGRPAAARAAGTEFDDLIGLAEKGGEGVEWQAPVIKVDAREKHIDPCRQGASDGCEEGVAEEVGLVDDEQRTGWREHKAGAIKGDGRGGEAPAVVRDQGEGVVAVVGLGLVDGDRAALVMGGGDAAEEFGGLAREHRPGDHSEARVGHAGNVSRRGTPASLSTMSDAAAR